MTFWLKKAAEILSADTNDLRELALMAGSDPCTFYRGADLNGADLRDQDLRGMDFKGADLDNIIVNDKTRFDVKYNYLLKNRQTSSFFISYSGKDITFAKEVNQILKEAGYNTIFLERDFDSKTFLTSIVEHLKGSARIISLYSPDYLNSEYCMKEALTALTGDPLNTKGRLIPIKIAECEPMGMLAHIAYLDLVSLLRSGQHVALKEIILANIDSENRQTGEDHALWYNPNTILHSEISQLPNFIARKYELDLLENLFFMSSMASERVAIVGLAGVGKTVLVKEYAWQHRNDYAGIWWIRASSRNNVINSLRELGEILVPEIEHMENQVQVAQLTLQAVSDSSFEKSWLLIYDDVNNQRDLDGLTPQQGADLIITSRILDWEGYSETIKLDISHPEDSIDLLLQLTGSEDRAGAAELANILGYLPLALEQAANFCRLTGFAEYIKAYQDLLKEPPLDSNYPYSVWKTFTLALDRVIEGDKQANKDSCPDVMKLLGPIAYLAPNYIPLDIFPEDYLSSEELVKITNELAEVSLVKFVNQHDASVGFSLHPILQEIIRDKSEESGRAETFKNLITSFIYDAFPSGDAPAKDVRFWPQVQRLEPHVITVLTYAPDRGQASEKTALLLNEYGQYLMVRAEYSVAEPLMRRALEIDEVNFGPDHPNVARDLNNLVQFFLETNRLKEAEPLIHRALRILTSCFGENHPKVASSLNNLAHLYKETKRFEEAEPLVQRALKIDQDSFGEDHPNVAISLNNLAQLYKETKRFEEAEPLVQRALKIDQDSFGANHPNVARNLNNLAQLYYASNRFEEAEPLYKQALEIVEQHFPEGHPYVEMVMKNISILEHEMGKKL